MPKRSLYVCFMFFIFMVFSTQSAFAQYADDLEEIGAEDEVGDIPADIEDEMLLDEDKGETRDDIVDDAGEFEDASSDPYANYDIEGGACSTIAVEDKSLPAGFGFPMLIACLMLMAYLFRTRKWKTGIIVFFFLLSSNLHASKSYDANAFKPLPFINSYYTVLDGGTIEQYSWNIGLFAHYQNDPILARTPRYRKVLEHQMMGDLLFSYGLFKWIDFGISLPILIYQTGEWWKDGSKPNKAGIGDIRVIPRFNLINIARKTFTLSVIPEVSIPTEVLTNDFISPGTFKFTPTIAMGVQSKWIDVAANAFYRMRKEVSIGNLTIGNEWGFRFGTTVKAMPDFLDVTAEVLGQTTSEFEFDIDNRNPLEVLGGVRFHLPAGVKIAAGGGAGIKTGYNEPDFRAFLGFSYTFTPAKSNEIDTDGDGITDDVDRCPREKEDYDGFEDEDGCEDKDNDGDGILDKHDKCPNKAEDFDNFQDKDGCPDLDNDGDGIPDEIDDCPLDPEDKDNFEDDDGCPDLDNDEDGIPDKKDKCPNKPGPKENNGCPVIDADNDGIPDKDDKCPNKVGPKENNGCPVKKYKTIVITKKKIELKKKVYFLSGKSRIHPQSYDILDEIADVIMKNLLRVRIEGHTDSIGGRYANGMLSKRRAHAVRKYLIKQGVDPDSLVAIGLGEDKPIDTNKTKRGRARNRRVEFIILK